MIVLTSRKAKRQALASLLGEIDTFVAGYDHQVKDFKGISPIYTVHSAGTRGAYVGYAEEYHRFAVNVIWKRGDADATEDNIDDLM